MAYRPSQISRERTMMNARAKGAQMAALKAKSAPRAPQKPKTGIALIRAVYRAMIADGRLHDPSRETRLDV